MDKIMIIFVLLALLIGGLIIASEYNESVIKTYCEDNSLINCYKNCEDISWGIFENYCLDLIEKEKLKRELLGDSK